MSSLSLSKQGSLTGAILLIAGCCIGAGMLGLPVLSGMAGFTPSLFMFLLCWLYMVCTGLILLEVNLGFKGDVSIITMAHRTLGWPGKLVGWVGFLFLFYTLMVAYITASGELLSDFYTEITGSALSPTQASSISCLLLGSVIFMGTYAVDQLNRFLMLGLVLAYLLLITVGAPHVNTQFLAHSDWPAVFLVVPAMIISFGYHNLIPTLKTYLHGDVNSLRLAIIIGSAIPLLIYLAWEWLILGLIPEEGFREAIQQGDMATRALKNAVGISWIVDLAQYFAFFAIVTSFLGVALSFVDFLADGLKIHKDVRGKLILIGLVLGLPFICALIYPGIFLIALSYAGGLGAVLLFGLLPAAMAWAGRYHQGFITNPLMPGQKAGLIVIMVIACAIMALQLF
jgi:tyrosine-specific transport protein